MSIFSAIQKGLSGVWKWLTSSKSKAALQTAGLIAEQALPIVKAIDEIVGGNPTLEAVTAAYEHFGEPFVADLAKENPGNALLNLATAVLRSTLPANQATLATHVLQTAVQIAVTAVKADPAVGVPSA